MPAYVYPTEFLFWAANPKHKEHKDLLWLNIKNNLSATKDMQKGNWLCDVNTDFFCEAQDVSKYIPLINNAIYPAIDAMFAELSTLCKPATSIIKKIWYNHYDPIVSNCQEVHTHPGSTYSGVYFLHLEEPNTTVFYSSVAATNAGLVTPAKQTEFTVEGDVLLFPSSLLHYVTPAKKQRVTIAFNIDCAYET